MDPAAIRTNARFEILGEAQEGTKELEHGEEMC